MIAFLNNNKHDCKITTAVFLMTSSSSRNSFNTHAFHSSSLIYVKLQTKSQIFRLSSGTYVCFSLRYLESLFSLFPMTFVKCTVLSTIAWMVHLASEHTGFSDIRDGSCFFSQVLHALREEQRGG